MTCARRPSPRPCHRSPCQRWAHCEGTWPNPRHPEWPDIAMGSGGNSSGCNNAGGVGGRGGSLVLLASVSVPSPR